MKKYIIIVSGFLLIISLTYSLEYIESSAGLQIPEWESGRTELEMADVNGDGHIDILSIGDHGSPYVNTQEHGIMVWFGDGQGNWSVYQNGDFGYGGIAIGDINNDGYMDVGYGMHHNYSSSDFGDSIMEVALGDGTGQNWTPWDDGISTGGDWGMFSTDFADIDNDGLLDIGSVSFGADDGIHIFLNHGDGTWNQSFGFLGGNSTMHFIFGDVNGDGNADFCAAHQYGSIYLGDGQGNFLLADGNLPPGGNLGRYGPALGDVDNDGDQDFSFTSSSGGIQVWSWQGNNTWAIFSGTLPTSGPYYLTQLYDMNIDGLMDVIAFGDSTITLWLGDGTGNWTQDATFYTTYPGTAEAFRVGGDADHNGYPDIVLLSEEGHGLNPINHLRFYKENSTPESLFVCPMYPRGKERFEAGSTHFIDWTCGVPPGRGSIMQLEFSTTGPNGPWSMITQSTPNNGRYQWLIPQGISSESCYIKYTAITNLNRDTAISIAITWAPFKISPVSGIKETKIPISEKPIIKVIPTISKHSIQIYINTFGLAKAEVKVYDNQGRLIRNLFKTWGTGEFSINWDKTDDNGAKVPLGNYFIVLEGPNRRLTEKVLIIN
jgi:FG-GAP-like repeat